MANSPAGYSAPLVTGPHGTQSTLLTGDAVAAFGLGIQRVFVSRDASELFALIFYPVPDGPRLT